MRSINLLFLFGIRRNCLRSGRSLSFDLSIRRAIKQIVVIIETYHFCQLLTNFIQNSAVKVNPICRRNYGDHQCGFRGNRSTTDHMFCVGEILEKKWEYSEALQLFIDFKKAYDSLRREVV